MSRSLGVLKLPNGGELEVTAYVGPAGSRRVQLTLLQGEGRLTAAGNTDADGVAELVGWLESWLLEGGGKIAAGWAGVPTSVVYIGLSNALERATAVDKIINPQSHGLPPWTGELRGAPSAEVQRASFDVLEMLRSCLELVPPPVNVRKSGAAIDGPSHSRVRDELAAEVHRDYGRALEELEASRTDGLESPRLEHDEDGPDVLTSLEDFGKYGTREELEPMKVIPLELEGGYIRHAEERELTPASAPFPALGKGRPMITVGVIGDCVRAVTGRAEELVRYCRQHDVIGNDRLEELAVMFLSCKERLDDILREAANQSRG